VARVKEECGVALFDRLVESQQTLAEGLLRLILRDHHGKAKLLQRIAHGAGVVDGLLQLRDVAIVVIADHQRHTLFSLGGRREREECGRDAGQRRQSGKPFRHQVPRLARLIRGSCQPSYAVVGKPAAPVQSGAFMPKH
jgi:hypothetical protein